MIWTSAQVRESLEKKATKLSLSMPQMQTLLSQERFLARLCQLKRKPLLYLERRQSTFKIVSAS